MNVSTSSRDAATPPAAERPHRMWRRTGRVVLGLFTVIVPYVDANRSPETLAAEHKQQERFQRTIWTAARIGLVCAFWAPAWPRFWPTTQHLSAETRPEIGVLQAQSQQIKTVLREDALLTHDNAQSSSAASPGKPAVDCPSGRAERRARPTLAAGAAADGAPLVELETRRRLQQSLHPLGSAGASGERLREVVQTVREQP